MADPVEKSRSAAADPAPQAAIAHADSAGAAVIDHDLPCPTCGYNLRGLSPKGECPGQAPVGRALHGDRLCYSNPRWVRTMASGMRLISSAGILALAYIVIRYLGPRVVGPAETRLINVLVLIASAVVLIIGGMGVLGLWMVTARDPALQDREPLFAPRRTLRMLVIVLVVALALYEPAKTWMPGARLGVLCLAGALSIACILGAFRYAMSLARRIPDRPLLEQTRGVMWGMILSYGLLSGLAALAVSDVDLPLLAMTFGFSCTLLVGCIIFTLWCLSLIGHYTAALIQAADLAEMTWAGDLKSDISNLKPEI